MNIQLISDLHLEFGDMELPGGDVLVMAGDICEIVRLENKEEHPNKRFFREELPKYQKVIYVLGNHEHYYGRYDKSFRIINDLKIENLTVLHNSSIDIDGYKFLGTTMWTDFGGDALTYTNARHTMNDYRRITIKDNMGYHKLNNKFILSENKKAMFFLKNTLKESDKKNIVITHHAPSHKSGGFNFSEEKEISYYCNNLDDFILESNIDYWFHGHIHQSVNYTIGKTKVITNPRGYIGHDAQENYNPLPIVLENVKSNKMSP